MVELEDAITNEDSEKKLKLSLMSKKDLENADYNSEEYKLFTFNFLGEPKIKNRDEFKIIKSISESDSNLQG